MLLPEASVIESGTAVLFLGAGFSADATNLNDDSIKDVSGLISFFLKEVGINSAEGYDLETAAEEYQLVHGEEKTAKALHSNFRSKTVTEGQRTTVCQPWYRIYTTNYDDVVERICTDEKKPYTTKEVTDPVEPPMPDTTQLIHIYGNITRSSESEFKKTFLLTETQRDNSPFIKSPWMRRFHDDVLSASTVVFVGFSLSDIDLRRLLGSLPSEVLRKVHFIARPSTNRPIINRMKRFGFAHPIGLEAFAAHLGNKRPGAPVRRYISLPVSLHELHFSQKLTSTVSSKDIENLMISGDVDLEKLAQADITGAPGSYTVTRSRGAYARAANNAAGDRPILVHSDIGNGKTVFAYQIAYQFSQKNHRVFRIQREPENIGEILSFLQAIDGPALVIFDDVMRFPNLPSAIVGIRRKDIIVLATVRSIVLETSHERVLARIGNATPIEIDLNTPLRDENLRIVKYLDVNGLLGRYADLTEREKLEFVEKKCGGQLRDIILTLYQSGSLHKRVEELLVNIQALDPAARDVIVFSALLSYADFENVSQFVIISDLVGYSGVLEDLRTTLAKHELSTMVRLDTGDVVIRSPALAQFILARVFSVEAILDIVKRALFTLDQFYVSEDDFVTLGKSLLKFSLYGPLIKGGRENEAIERFYDECRTLSFASSDPLFWVQRSICNMNNKQFDIAHRFVKTAYGLAEKRSRFDTYQIDNHNARLILTQSREEGVSPNGEREQHALSLLRSVLDRKSDDLYHPLSVMRLFAEIVDRWQDRLSQNQKTSLKKAIDAAIASVAKFRHAGRFRNLPGLRRRLNEASERLT